jgi:F0F1-type ATP synthase membrane subunit b/b'
LTTYPEPEYSYGRGKQFTRANSAFNYRTSNTQNEKVIAMEPVTAAVIVVIVAIVALIALIIFLIWLGGKISDFLDKLLKMINDLIDKLKSNADKASEGVKKVTDGIADVTSATADLEKAITDKVNGEDKKKLDEILEKVKKLQPAH